MPSSWIDIVIFIATVATVGICITATILSRFDESSLQYKRDFAAGIDPRTILSKPHNQDQFKIRGQKIARDDEEEGHVKIDVNVPPGYPKQYNYVDIINTPKCGTGGLYDHFYRSFQCYEVNMPLTPVDDSIAQIGVIGCPFGYAVQRGHLIEFSTPALVNNFDIIQPDKCLVVTAIRDPVTFLTSLFMEKHDNLCALAEKKKHKPKDTLKMYKEWLKSSHKYFYFPGISYLLNEFGAESLTHEMENIKKNQGFSLLPHPSKLQQHGINIQSDATSDEGNPPSPYSNCDLLFLKLEDHNNWRAIFNKIMVVPENKQTIYYKKSNASSREQICPALADHYRAIKNYKLSPEEKSHVIHDIPYMAEWFQVYGH